MMNSLDTTNATTFKTSLWDLLPPELEQEILELAAGLEHRERMTKITSELHRDLRMNLLHHFINDLTENYTYIDTMALVKDKCRTLSVLASCSYQYVLEVFDEIYSTGITPHSSTFCQNYY